MPFVKQSLIERFFLCFTVTKRQGFPHTTDISLYSILKVQALLYMATY